MPRNNEHRFTRAISQHLPNAPTILEKPNASTRVPDKSGPSIVPIWKATSVIAKILELPPWGPKIEGFSAWRSFITAVQSSESYQKVGGRDLSSPINWSVPAPRTSGAALPIPTIPAMKMTFPFPPSPVPDMPSSHSIGAIRAQPTVVG
jgi:hypothetical protein